MIEQDTTYELTFGQGVDVTGRFIQGAEPVTAHVAMFPARLEVPMSYPLPLLRSTEGLVRSVETDKQGSFRIPQFMPGRYYLEAELATGRIYRGEEFVIPAVEDLRHDAEKDQGPPTWDLGEILMNSGAKLEFLVTNLEGLPLANTTVGCGQGEGPYTLTEFKAKTDSEGWATISGLDPAAPTRTLCRANGHRELRESFDLPPPIVECVLEPLAGLVGEVSDLDDEPLGGATITLGNLEDGSSLSRVSQDQGRFEFQDLVAGRYDLVMVAPGFAAERQSVNLTPGETLELDKIALRPGRELWGLVLDAETGAAVPAARLHVVEPTGGGAAVADDDGEFRLITDDHPDLRLQVMATGYATGNFEVQPEDFLADEPWTAEISVGGEILVRVLRESIGEPCRDCRVNISPGPVGVLRTDAQGEVLSPPLAAGRYSVQVPRVESLGTILIVQGGVAVKTVTVRPRQITEVVFGQSRSVLQVHFDPPLPPGWDLQAHGSTMASYRPQADGSFAVKWRSGELTELHLSEAGGRFVRLGIIPPDHRAPDLELPLWNTLVTGNLQIEESVAPAQQVELHSLQNGTLAAHGQSDATGSFGLPFVAPGGYALVVGGKVLRQLTIVDGETHRLGTLRLLP